MSQLRALVQWTEAFGQFGEAVDRLVASPDDVVSTTGDHCAEGDVVTSLPSPVIRQAALIAVLWKAQDGGGPTFGRTSNDGYDRALTGLD